MRAGGIIVAAVGLAHCLEPTEITLVLTTDVPCSAVNGAAVAVGPPGDETRDPAATTTSCDGGMLGTLVVVPSGAIDDVVGVRVMLGVGATQAESCHAPDFAGCVVARRELGYIRHTPLTLPIELQRACLDDPCDPTSSCVNGQCVDGGVTCDDAGSCGVAPPDAGRACDVPATLVIPSTAPFTPHIVPYGAGYAIGWETPKGAYAVRTTDASGNTLADVTAPQTLAGGTPLGALGTDGTNFAVAFTAGSAGLILALDPASTVLTDDPFPGLPPLRGFGFDATHQLFRTLTVETGAAMFVTAHEGDNQISTYGIPAPSGVTDPWYAEFDGTSFGMFHDASSCYVAPAVFNGSAVQFGNLEQFTSCAAARYAENSPTEHLYALGRGDPNAATLVVTPNTQENPLTTIGAVDPQAIVALPSRAGAFHVVWSHAQQISSAVVYSNASVDTPRIIASGTSFPPETSGVGIGFDAISDAGASSYAAVWWASTPTPGVYFARFCD